jgi:hypothetical protein
MHQSIYTKQPNRALQGTARQEPRAQSKISVYQGEVSKETKRSRIIIKQLRGLVKVSQTARRFFYSNIDR